VPNFEAVNGVAAASVEAVNGVAKANVEAINGVSPPAAASGATRVVAAFDDAYVGYANLADVDDAAVWEGNTFKAGASGDNWDLTEIAYGKNGSGDPWYVATVNANNPELIYDDDGDITDEERWSEINVTHNLKQRTIAWGANVWVSAGMMSSSNQYIYRSTDGQSWTPIDVSGLTDMGSVYAAGCYALTSDGAGSWWFAIGGKIYESTDHAQNWSLIHSVTVGGGKIWDLVYTNATLVCLYANQGAKLISAAASDTTDWSGALAMTDSNNASLNGNTAKRMAAASGRVVVIDTARSLAVDVNGKTMTIQGTRQDLPDEGNLNCICADGAGNWYTGSDGGTSGPDGGDICRSTDNGLSWSKIVEGINVLGNRKVEDIVADVYLPL
jgi:hypothetical protein